MTLRTALAGAAFVAVLASTHVHAKPIIVCDRTCYAVEDTYMLGAKPKAQKPVKATVKMRKVSAPDVWSAPAFVVTAAAASTETQILPHPDGCPRVAFCGCGAAVKVFGRAVRELWLAAAWFKFPASAPGPGKVAVRRHHVMVIEAMLSDGRAVVYDANSGGHKTRRWVRSLAGYSIRNPHGVQVASR